MEHRQPEHDVRKLCCRRIGQPALEVVFPHRDNARRGQRERGNDRNRDVQSDLADAGYVQRKVANQSGTENPRMTRAMPNAPDLTTATAWSSPETGVGATIASASHECSGISAALTPKPAMSRKNAACA